MIFLAAIIVCFIVAILFNRGISGIEEKPFRGFPLILVAVILQMIIFTERFFYSNYRYLTPYIYILSLLILLAAMLLNLRYRGLRIALIGFLSNLTVIVANRGYMPQDINKLQAMGKFDKVDMLNKFGKYYNGTIMSQETHLNFLGDIIAPTFLKPYASVHSIGDIILVIGLCYFIFEFIHKEERQIPEDKSIKV
ncbi:MAG TPA: DUF5317 family protein [bacterium]|nr:DUF5317 domain-containing protein [Dictyoglomota bacterium]HON72883.1 DUF5317 family protein [bacterium]HRR91829.1 DUF5317 family protein [bacterium]